THSVDRAKNKNSNEREDAHRHEEFDERHAPRTCFRRRASHRAPLSFVAPEELPGVPVESVEPLGPPRSNPPPTRLAMSSTPSAALGFNPPSRGLVTYCVTSKRLSLLPSLLMTSTWTLRMLASSMGLSVG